jgi:hypothetical protein
MVESVFPGAFDSISAVKWSWDGRAGQYYYGYYWGTQSSCCGKPVPGVPGQGPMTFHYYVLGSRREDARRCSGSQGSQHGSSIIKTKKAYICIPMPRRRRKGRLRLRFLSEPFPPVSLSPDERISQLCTRFPKINFLLSYHYILSLSLYTSPDSYN